MVEIPFRGFALSARCEEGRARLQAFFGMVQRSYPSVPVTVWDSVAVMAELTFVLGRQEESCIQEELLGRMVKLMETVERGGQVSVRP